MRRNRVLDLSFVAQFAPIHAPSRLPARRLMTIWPYGASSANGTLMRQAGRAVMTTMRLIALFMMMACNAANPKTLMRSGNRNSASPRPIIPPSTPTRAPPSTPTRTCRESPVRNSNRRGGGDVIPKSNSDTSKQEPTTSPAVQSASWVRGRLPVTPRHRKKNSEPCGPIP